MSEPIRAIRCGVAFPSIEAFRASFVANGPACFVPYPDEVASGEVMDIDVTVVEARLELRGEVVGPDFDEHGNVGLQLKLDDASWKLATQVAADMGAGAHSDGVFATTRMQINPVLTAAPAEPVKLEPVEQARALLVPGIVVDGRFRIEAHLATGGMGEVYRAQHVHLKRAIALKLLRRSLSEDPEMWGRFEREAQLVSKLENPHVVRVFDFGRTNDGQLFLAMEFVEGETLEARLKKGPLPPPEAVEILAQVLDGLNEAHGLGVVHRDLKPPNIMLGKRREGGERAKILDFGIARLGDAPSDARLTQSGMIVGTPAYLSPEQALADDLDHRTDIYAMGCVAYELLTGRPPFTGTDLRKVISQHLTAAPVDPSKVRPELAKLPGLCAAVLKALAKERENRFQNVLEFREALRTSLESPGQSVPLATLVPEPSAPWPPASDWQPAPAPPTSTHTPPPTAAAEADDFFASVGSGSTPSAPAVAAAPAASQQQGEGVFVRLEVLGPLPNTPQGQACAARVHDAVMRAGGFIAATDEEGVTFGLIGKGGYPAGRATRAMLLARELVAQESARLRVAANVRGLAGLTSFPLAKPLGEKVRRQLATGRANTLWLDTRLAGPASRLCELGVSETQGLVSCGAPRRRARAVPPLLGRKALVDGFERRLTSLQQGVAAPLLLTGPSGSGHTALSQTLVASARKKGALALSTVGLPEPFGALIDLLCAAVNVHPAERMSRLAAALEPLPLIDSVRHSALGLAGVRPLPVALTPAQAAHALRGVLRGVGADKQVVLSFDGLHGMDQGSVEAFISMTSRTVPRELIVGFTAPSAYDAKLASVQSAAIPALAPAELVQLLSGALASVASASLSQYVLEHSKGLPRVALQLLSWLDDGGLLVDADGAIEPSEPGLLPPAEGPVVAALQVMPADLRRVLQTAALLGARFDQAILREVLPGATQQVLAALQSAGWITMEGPRRARFTSPATVAVVPPLPVQEAQAIHLAAAQALITQGTADAASVDSLEVANHLTAGGDGARAAPLWKHALDQALVRRDPRSASRAWAGVAAAVSLLAKSEAQVRTQVDAMARSASQSLAFEDTARARALLDAVSAQAASLPAPSAEYLLVEARVLRLEARRVKAVEVLTAAMQAAQSNAVKSLVLAEYGEGREVEGDLDGATRALEQARVLAPEAAELARWHGEVDLAARLEARLATIAFARRDVGKALALLESSLTKWRAANWPFAEARVMATTGTVLAYQQRFDEAAKAYQSAALAGGRCGDLRFQARALLQQAKAIRKVQGDSAQMKQVALEARKLAVVLGWEEGRLDASALLGQ